MKMENRELKKYDNLNPVILEFLLQINREQPSILDVGCWTGTLGRALKERNFQCRIDGIDIAEEALRTAQRESGYEKVFRSDINHLKASDLDRDRYDVIVLGDVLEHIIDPARLITAVRPALRREGVLVVSLPNIAFLKYRLLHLMGHWDYTETGVMDKTHLRFFTVPSMKRFFEAQGLRILRSKELVAVSDIYWPVKKLAKIWPNMFALQMIFVLKPVSPEGPQRNSGAFRP